MNALSRPLVAFALLLSVAVQGASARPLAIDVAPVPLSAESPETARVGVLAFQGALALTSPDRGFGGLSGLELSRDGRRLVFVSDAGDWIVAMPRHDTRGWLTGLDAAETGRLRGLSGRPLKRRRDRDAESITRLGPGYAVAFEHRHRIWHYRAGANPLSGPALEIPPPPALRAAPPNGGIEALVALGDGRLVALAEHFPNDAPYRSGWVRTRGRWQALRWRREGLFVPVGAATLPGGDLLVLERRFTLIGGFATRIVRLDPAAIRPGATVSGRELARLEPPLIEENFEGIAVAPSPGGGVRIYLVADDNFLALQRTVLIQFGLAR